MHELSIAQSILDIVRTNVPTDESCNVRTVRVCVGELAGVVAESLQFAYHALVADSPFHHSVIEIERMPYTVRCRMCGETTAPAPIGSASCKRCGSEETELNSGMELSVVDIVLQDVPTEQP
jgi:hydrogenase nickel incorporation protein HypA/HybF